MQVQGKDVIHGARYSSPLDCAVKTLESEGVSSTGLLLLFSSLITVTRLLSCFVLQLKGIFRGGLATLFREAIGNAVFFCTYEYSRYWMHNYLDSVRFSDSSHFVLAKDIGIGVMSGGISGMAVSIYNCLKSFAVHILHPHYDKCVFSAVLDSYPTAGCGKNHNTDRSGPSCEPKPLADFENGSTLTGPHNVAF